MTAMYEPIFAIIDCGYRLNCHRRTDDDEDDDDVMMTS